MSVKPNIKNKIIREIQAIKGDLDIYADMKDDDIQTLQILVIGPKDSPYYGGFLVFKVNFTSDFPFLPPIVKFITPKYRPFCRLHPNLYQDGKVCLSILNTWGSKEWSPILTIEKLFLTIQGLLDDNPIAHEPGQEKKNKSHPEAINYYLVALQRTLRTGVLDMFKHPDLSDNLRQTMADYFTNHRQQYLTMVEQLKDYDNQEIKCFHGTEKITYQQLKTELETFLQ